MVGVRSPFRVLVSAASGIPVAIDIPSTMVTHCRRRHIYWRALQRLRGTSKFRVNSRIDSPQAQTPKRRFGRVGCHAQAS